LLKHAQKNKTLNKHLTSKLQVSPNFTLDSVADSNYREKCAVGGILIFEWTLCYFGIMGGHGDFTFNLVVECDSNQNKTSRSLRRKAISDVGLVHCFIREGRV
jgi:hypothetical protein